MAVTVIGGGVIGLTTALTLARTGHRVRCVRDRAAEDTVSHVAGGLWFPYHAEPRDLVHAWGRTAYARFACLATDPDSGVRLVPGLMVHRTAPDRWWAEGIPWREAATEGLPAGVVAGTELTLPLIDMARFLPWLERECRAAGVVLERAGIGDLRHVGGDVVVATGLRSGSLTGDAGLTPARGQVVVLANPGVTRWYVDGDDPERLTYVLPHLDRVVCGGTDVVGSADLRVDPSVEAALLARARAAVPALAAAPVLASRVGLRPLAPRVRLALVERDGRRVVTNYGHGGAGVTLSWGCAEAVADLLGRPG